MGRHNGKAKSTHARMRVGKALMNSKAAVGSGRGAGGEELPPWERHSEREEGPGQQSVVDMNDLEEFMALADLQDRDWAAERENVVVIQSGAESVSHVPVAERRKAEAECAHRLRVPRRPAWDKSTSKGELDALEKVEFLEWRRDLAKLEEDPRLTLTPFEKNPEVWRQLWRVMERSDLVLQVVDSRNPLFFQSLDLEVYAAELSPPRDTVLLMNKSDLLPAAVRAAWADYFDRRGVRYLFWSAAAADAALGQEEGPGAGGASGPGSSGGDPRCHVYGREELLVKLQKEALRAVKAAGAEDPRAREENPRRLMVGLVGYPNVGKSSTINALRGEKKTTVSATPGKTKHFQTLIMNDDLCLCDCPGLVFPKFADSRAEMVANGVLPIHTLQEIRGPVDAIIRLFSRKALEKYFNVRLPLPRVGEDPRRPPTAAEALRGIALSRGFVVQGGRPDETKAGRLLLKDFTDGKLLHCTLPPGVRPQAVAGGGGEDPAFSVGEGSRTGISESARPAGGAGPETGPAPPAPSGAGGSGSGRGGATYEQDMSLMRELHEEKLKKERRRPDYKFKKKASRSKGSRGQWKETGEGDGSGFAVGKRGGILRVPTQP